MALAGTVLFAANITTESGSANVPSNPTEAFAELSKIVLQNVTDKTIGNSVDREIYDVINNNFKERFFQSNERGVLARVSIYKTSNGFSYLPSGGVEFIGHDKNPATAYCNHLKNGSIGASPPQSLVLSRESSYFMWLTPVGNRIDNQKIKYPFYQEIMQEGRQLLNDNLCS